MSAFRCALGRFTSPFRAAARSMRRSSPRQFDDAGYAKAPVLERLDHLREALDELRGDPAKVARPLRQTEFPVQEDEEARIPQLQPQPSVVEVREGDEEVGHRTLFTAEESEEIGGEFACAVHALIVACDFGPSGNARSWPLAGIPSRGLLPPRATVPREPSTRPRFLARVLSTAAFAARNGRHSASSETCAKERHSSARTQEGHARARRAACAPGSSGGPQRRRSHAATSLRFESVPGLRRLKPLLLRRQPRRAGARRRSNPVARGGAER